MKPELVPPLNFEVVVPLAPERAFALFAKPAAWWPLRRFSVFEDDASRCELEPFVGGAFFEVNTGGERAEWGRVIAWEPPERIAMTWHAGREASAAQQLEIRFTAAPGGTRVALKHFGWEALGDQAEEVRSRYANGWVSVIGTNYVNAAQAAAKEES